MSDGLIRSIRSRKVSDPSVAGPNSIPSVSFRFLRNSTAPEGSPGNSNSIPAGAEGRANPITSLPAKYSTPQIPFLSTHLGRNSTGLADSELGDAEPQNAPPANIAITNVKATLRSAPLGAGGQSDQRPIFCSILPFLELFTPQFFTFQFHILFCALSRDLWLIFGCSPMFASLL
jgi:hypothetical protein